MKTGSGGVAPIALSPRSGLAVRPPAPSSCIERAPPSAGRRAGDGGTLRPGLHAALDDGRDRHEREALRLQRRQPFGERGDGAVVRMADADGGAALARHLLQLGQLLVDRAALLLVVEEYV